jgi:hypothetical protein
MKKAYKDHESFTAIKNPHKDNIRQDIYALQSCESKEIFDSVYGLFKKTLNKVKLQLMNFLFILIKFGFVSIQGLPSVFHVQTMDWNQIMVK